MQSYPFFDSMRPMTKAPESRQDRKKRKFFDFRYVAHERRHTLVLACVLFWSIISFLVIRYFFLGTVIVEGKSMLPALWDGEQYLIHRWIYMVREPKRGEVVVIQDPTAASMDVKRIVALPNEEIEIRDGEVYINDRKLEEPYLPPETKTSSYKLRYNRYVIRDKHYFVLGDNRQNSYDSRHFGAISRKNVLGKINKNYE